MSFFSRKNLITGIQGVVTNFVSFIGSGIISLFVYRTIAPSYPVVGAIIFIALILFGLVLWGWIWNNIFKR